MRASPHPESLAAKAAGRDRWIAPGLVLCALMLLGGWFAPMMSVERLFILREEVSIAEAVIGLLGDGEIFLGLVLLVFCVLFPAAKIGSAWWLWRHVDAGRGEIGPLLARIDAFGKWSMLDVFVVALAVVAIKISLVSDVEIHGGVYLFAAAVLSSMLLVRRITALAHAAAAPNGTGNP